MGNPLAQTFTIFPQYATNQDGIFLTQIDLYFQQIDPNFGVVVELRNTDSNGYPASTIIPFSRVHLTPSQINVSTNASVATSFVFSAPIFLQSNNVYAFAIIPDGNSPDYLIWTAQTGEVDVLNSSYSVTQNWGDGSLFSSTNDTAWQPISAQNLKFTLYNANFTSNSGTINLTNADDEFLGIQNVQGNYLVGEHVFQFTNTPITGTVSFSNNSLTVTGNGTLFQTVFTPNSYIILHNYYAPTPAGYFSVCKVATVNSNTNITLDRLPSFTANNVCALNAPVGKLIYYNQSTGDITLGASTSSNNTFCFTNGSIIISDTTATRATISAVKNKIISYFQPLFYRTSVTGTSISANANLIDTSYSLNETTSVTFNNSNYLDTFDAVIASKSLEIQNNTGKSFVMPVTMTSNYPVLSPTLDLQSTSILRYHNLINNDLTNENTISGNTKSKYESLIVTLENGQNAENLLVYLNSYEPVGTDVEVWMKIQNNYDPDSFTAKSWTQLARQQPVTKGDPSNRNDIEEYVYQVANYPPVTIVTGTINGTNGQSNVTGVNTSFTQYISNGSVVVISNGTSNAVFQATTVANDAFVTLSGPIPFSLSSGTMYVFNDPLAAYLDPQNSNTVSYFNSTSLFSTYLTFQIKINLLANASYLVPRIEDVRAIAIST